MVEAGASEHAGHAPEAGNAGEMLMTGERGGDPRLVMSDE